MLNDDHWFDLLHDIGHLLSEWRDQGVDPATVVLMAVRGEADENGKRQLFVASKQPEEVTRKMMEHALATTGIVQTPVTH